MMKSGFVADGIFKLLVAGFGVIMLASLEDFFGAPRWLVITAVVLLFVSAAAEISYGARKGERSYIKYLALFDGLWVLTLLVGILLALVDNPAGAYVVFGYIALGSLGVAIVFTTGANGPEFAAEAGDT